MDTLIFLFVFALGACIGSFLNVVILRTRAGTSLWWPASHCPRCKSPLSWSENVPLVSFIALRGRCRHCRAPISWQYPLVELATALIFGWLFISYGLTIQFWLTALFACFLVLIFVYDIRFYQIPDQFTLPAAAVALLGNLYLQFDISDLLLAMLIGTGFFAVQYLVSRGRWIGSGDIRLGAVMGLMLGWQKLLVALGLAYVVGSLVGIILVLGGRKQFSSRVPFGTFLSAATLASLVFGDKLISWYLSFLGV